MHESTVVSSEDPSVQLLHTALMPKATMGQSMHFATLVTRSDTGVDSQGRTDVTMHCRGVDGTTLRSHWWNYPLPDDQRPKPPKHGLFTWLMTLHHMYRPGQRRSEKSSGTIAEDKTDDSNSTTSLFVHSDQRMIGEKFPMNTEIRT